MTKTATALLPSQTSSHSSTSMPSRPFVGYATMLKDLLHSRTALDDSLGRLDLLLPAPTDGSSMTQLNTSGGPLTSLGG
jgi:hypothetical protein